MKKIVYYILAVIIIIIELPILLLASIVSLINFCLDYVCNGLNKFNIILKNKFIPLRNSIVQVKEPTKDAIWTRINDELLSKEEAEKLAKEYEIKGYDTYIS